MRTRKAIDKSMLSAVSLLALFAVAGVAPGAFAAGSERPAAAASLPAVTRVCLLADATDSVNVPMPGGTTRRDAYLAATRAIIRATQHAGLPLTLGRACGVTETLWDAAIMRKDFATITALIESALSCDGRTSALAVKRRAAGTGLVNAVEWLARQPDGSVLALVTDGINTVGPNPRADFLRALDRLPAGVRARLWLIGLDEGVRDAIGPRVGHAAGLFDLQSATEQLTSFIKRKGK